MPKEDLSPERLQDELANLKFAQDDKAIGRVKALEEARVAKTGADAAQPDGKIKEMLGAKEHDPKGWKGYTEEGVVHLTKLSPDGKTPQYTIKVEADKFIVIDVHKDFSGEMAFARGDDKFCALKYEKGELTNVVGDKEILSDSQLKIWDDTRVAKVFLETGGEFEDLDLKRLMDRAKDDRTQQATIRSHVDKLKGLGVEIPPGITEKTLGGKTDKVLCGMSRVGNKISIDKVDPSFSGRIWLKDGDGNCAMIQYKDGKAVGFINPGNKCKALDPKTQADIEASVKQHLGEKMKTAEGTTKGVSEARIAPDGERSKVTGRPRAHTLDSADMAARLTREAQPGILPASGAPNTPGTVVSRARSASLGSAPRK